MCKKRRSNKNHILDMLRAKVENGGKEVPAWFGCSDDLQRAIRTRAKRDGASFKLKSRHVKRVARGMFGDTDIGVALEHLQGQRKDLARLDGTSAEEQDLVLKKKEVGGTILRAK